MLAANVPPVALLGPDAEHHDPLAAAVHLPSFAEVEASLTAPGVSLHLPVTRDTFSHLHLTVRWAAERTGSPECLADLPGPFEPRPLYRAHDLLRGWVEQVRFALQGTAITVGDPDEDLSGLLHAVARAAGPENEGILLRLLGALTGGVFRGPHTFHLDVANSCNVNCKYCWFHSPLSKDRSDAERFNKAWKHETVDWEVFTRLVDDLDHLGAREDVLLSGKGEPLLHPRILEMIAYIKARRMRLSLFSNGVLVSKKVSESLVGEAVDLLYVSLSSASHEVYEAIHPGHPGRELDEVKSNIAWLTNWKKREGRTLPQVMMVDVVNALNASELLDFYEMSRELGAEHVRFQLVHVQAYNQELKLREEQVARLRRDLAEAHRRETQGGPHIVDNIDYQLETLDVASGNWGNNRLPGEGCYVGWSFSRSWTNGDVSFCCSPKVVGNLEETRFADLWKGPEYSAFRNAAKDLAGKGDLTFRNGARLLGEHCHGCPNYEGIGKLSADLRRYGLASFVRGRDGEKVGRVR